MNRAVMAAAAALFLTAAVSCARYDTPSGTALRLDAIMADRPDFSLEKCVMELNDLIDPGADKAAASAELDAMTAMAKEAIADNADPQAIMDAMNRVFFTNYGFTFDNRFSALLMPGAAPAGAKEALDAQIGFTSVPRVIQRRQGICLSLAVVYLIAGERLGLPLYGVLVPGHIFVRYSDRSHSGINTETTFGGMEYYDYAATTGSQFLEGTDYNRLLTKRETAAAALNNYATILMSEGRAKDAELALKKSIEVLPALAENRVNLGALYLDTNRLDEGEEQLLTAVKILPKLPMVRTLLGELYRYEKRFVLARENYLMALAMNPADKTAARGLQQAEKGESGGGD